MRPTRYLALLVLLSMPYRAEAERRAFGIEDLYRVKGISDLRVSPGGNSAIFTVTTSDLARNKRTGHIWRMDVDGRNLQQLTFAEQGESSPLFSPDGKWISFVSSRGGETNLYLLPTEGGEARQLTRFSAGVSDPLWSPDGKELFYVNDGRLFSVAIQTQPGLTFANPVPLPITGFTQAVTTARQYDITPDGKQFIVVLPPGQGTGNARPTVPIQIVLNWFEDLKQRVPTGKH